MKKKIVVRFIRAIMFGLCHEKAERKHGVKIFLPPARQTTDRAGVEDRDMEIKILRADDLVTVAALIGRLDLHGEHEITKAFKKDVIDRGKPVVIELSGVVFMSSVGIEMLILAAKELEEKGVRMVIAAPMNMVEKILRRTGVEEIIPIAPDTEAALSLLGLAQSTPA